MAITDVIKRVKNVFSGPTTVAPVTYNQEYSYMVGSSYAHDSERPRHNHISDKTIVGAVYNTIALDFAGVPFKHIKEDDQGRYFENVDSKLNETLLFKPNLDQTPQSFRQDIAHALFAQGTIAIVPVDISPLPNGNGRFDIHSVRVGEIKEWFPRHVKVSLYNEQVGKRQEIIVEKSFVAIVENPKFDVMNAPNSTLQRLLRKLQLLDIVDEQSNSGKLDLIIQLPYVIRTEAKREQAEIRKKDIEMQLKGSQYGIAFSDATEKITQLNRPAENNLKTQITELTELLYSQLGITAKVMDGTADEATMLNYYNRTIDPILNAVAESMQAAFLGRSGYKNSERIKFYRTPFAFITAKDFAEVADKFSRNEIFTTNEIRSFVGVPPSKEEKADMLQNSNMPQPGMDPAAPPVPAPPDFADMDKVMSEVLDGLTKDIDSMVKGGTE